MAAYKILLVLLMAVIISPATSTDISRNQDLVVATEEMVKANYFTFVMLIKMSPLDPRIQGNVTFLMPNDRMLSKVSMPEYSVSDFLLRHSIPAPLLIDQLVHIPTGSFIPSSMPDYMFKIFNDGRRNFYLNSVKIISPNICTAGSSIRCHGIDGPLLNTTSPLTPCSNSKNQSVAPLPVPAAPSPLPATSIPAHAPANLPRGLAPAQTGLSHPQKSGCPQWLSHGWLWKLLGAFVIFYVM